jgi:hypothetical protein
MKKVILLGTEHPVQLGEVLPEKFASLLIDVCETNNVKAIAEEINEGDNTVALMVSEYLQLKHLYADPDSATRRERGIPADIPLDLINEYGNTYPDINVWPREPSEDNLSKVVWEEYYRRTENSYRIREQIWLENIIGFNTWPLLFVCGTDHFEEFSKLMRVSEIEVIESHKHWMP